MKNKNLSWAGALLVFALLLWCTAATPGKIAATLKKYIDEGKTGVNAGEGFYKYK